MLRLQRTGDLQCGQSELRKSTVGTLQPTASVGKWVSLPGYARWEFRSFEIPRTAFDLCSRRSAAHSSTDDATPDWVLDPIAVTWPAGQRRIDPRSTQWKGPIVQISPFHVESHAGSAFQDDNPTSHEEMREVR